MVGTYILYISTYIYFIIEGIDKFMLNSVVLVKNGGFYSCYGDDCYILHFLYGYSISKNKTSFPLNVYEKIINNLEELNISYIDKSSGKTNDFKDLNRYEEFVNNGKKKFEINKRIMLICDKLPSLSEDKIEHIINYIEGVVNE